MLCDHRVSLDLIELGVIEIGRSPIPPSLPSSVCIRVAEAVLPESSLQSTPILPKTHIPGAIQVNQSTHYQKLNRQLLNSAKYRDIGRRLLALDTA